MIKINSFRSLRPIKKLVEKVATQAYSNYSKEEIQQEIQQNKYSFLNIIADHQTENINKRFKSIREKIKEFKKKGILEKEKEKSIYIYRQSKNNIKYTGLICAIELQDYKNRKIKIHEKTIEKRELLFSKYLSNTKIHAEPVLLTYDDELEYIKKKHMSPQKKIYDFKSFDNTQHEIWSISDTQETKEIITKFEKIQNLYIADGHHRMASSLRYSVQSKCLAYILPKKELKTYPFHRLVNGNKKIIQDIITQLKIEEISWPDPKSKMIQFYMQKKWYKTIDKAKTENTVEELLVSRLIKNILAPLFNIKDERTNKTVSFLPGSVSIKNLIKQVKNQDILFIMNSINIDTIIKIANENKTTPPKSTFILPKIPSGLIMMELK